VPISSRRSTSAPVVKESALTDNKSKSQSLYSRAKREAVIRNNRLYNTVVGTGACINPIPIITLPLMGIAIMADRRVPEPESKFYKDLDSESKKQYKKIYINALLQLLQ
jgi:hypothetical protein